MLVIYLRQLRSKFLLAAREAQALAQHPGQTELKEVTHFLERGRQVIAPLVFVLREAEVEDAVHSPVQLREVTVPAEVEEELPDPEEVRRVSQELRADGPVERMLISRLEVKEDEEALPQLTHPEDLVNGVAAEAGVVMVQFLLEKEDMEVVPSMAQEAEVGGPEFRLAELPNREEQVERVIVMSMD